MLDYAEILIFTSEAARSRNQPVVDAVLEFIRALKIAARCIVTRGIAGCYENGEVATDRVEVLSFNRPVRMDIVLPAAEAGRVLDALSGIVTDGIVALQDLKVIRHGTKNAFFPRQLLVRDVMTPAPESVAADSAAGDVARRLLASIFTGLPVVDETGRPIGIITQGDLIKRGGLPIRLGLLAAFDPPRADMAIEALCAHSAAQVMSTPAITISADRSLAEAVNMMLSKGVKRLPVVDGHGILTGMLSRIDIFRTVMREAPDWNAFRAQKIEVAQLRTVADILRRDTHTVLPETPLNEVIRVIDDNDIQRVAVVDERGKLQGLISDRDLLHYFKQQEEGIWGLLARVKHPFQPNACADDLHKCLIETRAGAVMNTELYTIREAELVETAIRLMTEKSLKRLPVVDEAGRFKGMISRDSLLRTGFGKPGCACLGRTGSIPAPGVGE
jgi:CBS domain-containing protein